MAAQLPRCGNVISDDIHYDVRLCNLGPIEARDASSCTSRVIIRDAFARANRRANTTSKRRSLDVHSLTLPSRIDWITLGPSGDTATVQHGTSKNVLARAKTICLTDLRRARNRARSRRRHVTTRHGMTPVQSGDARRPTWRAAPLARATWRHFTARGSEVRAGVARRRRKVRRHERGRAHTWLQG
jgi:hypothetical protein